jgi:hypothetical protein
MRPSKWLVVGAVIWSIPAMSGWISPVIAANWLPNKVLLKKLGPIEAAGKYQIRVPLGYIVQQKYGRDGFHASVWVGPTRADRTRPHVLMVFISPLPGGEYTLDQVFNSMLAGVARRHNNWKQSSTEHDTVNGLTGLRAYWRGTEITKGRPEHGFSYVVQDGKDFVQLSSQEFDAHQKPALPLAEASILTFKKR